MRKPCINNIQTRFKIIFLPIIFYVLSISRTPLDTKIPFLGGGAIYFLLQGADGLLCFACPRVEIKMAVDDNCYLYQGDFI